MIEKDTNSKKIFAPLSDREEEIGKIIVNCAYKVHKELGPGLLEKVYEICFCHELRKAGLEFKRQIDVPVTYDELVFEVKNFIQTIIITAKKAIPKTFKIVFLFIFKIENIMVYFLINCNKTSS